VLHLLRTALGPRSILIRGVAPAVAAGMPAVVASSAAAVIASAAAGADLAEAVAVVGAPVSCSVSAASYLRIVVRSGVSSMSARYVSWMRTWLMKVRWGTASLLG
jgi:hypothetical protein